MEDERPSPPGGSRPSSVESTERVQSPVPSVIGATKKEKGRVRFNSTAALEPPAFLQQVNISKESQDTTPKLLKPRPSLLRGNSYNSVISVQDEEEDNDPRSDVAISARAAQERARHVAATVLGSHSAPGSRRPSVDSDADTIRSHESRERRESLRLQELHDKLSDWRFNKEHIDDQGKGVSEHSRALKQEAYNLVRSHSVRHGPHEYPQTAPALSGLSSGAVTPTEERDAEVYIPPPQQFRGSTLANLLMLYKHHDDSRSTYSQSQASEYSEVTTPASSGAATPTRKKWYEKDRSTDTLSNLVEASARLATVKSDTLAPPSPNKRPKRPRYKRSPSSRLMKLGRPRIEDEIRITINIAETLSRQKYIIKMCKALMMYGAPTHRLEEYLTMTARVLEIDGQFLYLPGCMIISFDDKQTHTTEVKIVRTSQGIDLGKLKDIHEIYKSVLHDVYGVDEAIDKISVIMAARDKFHRWVRVLIFGLASAAVAPFAFGGRWIDLPFCFALGMMVGWLQIIVAPKSALYNNLFEISATIFTSFLSRALGSIGGGKIFCFSAMAQSSIALILPGWFVCKFLLLSSLMQPTPLLTRTYSELSPRVAVASSRARFHPPRICHHLFFIPRLRHHGGDRPLRAHRRERHIRYNMLQHHEPPPRLHLRAPIHHMPRGRQPSQMETAPHHGTHLLRRLPREFLQQPQIPGRPANRKHARRLHGRRLRKPALEVEAWRRGSRSPAGYFCSGA